MTSTMGVVWDEVLDTISFHSVVDWFEFEVLDVLAEAGECFDGFDAEGVDQDSGTQVGVGGQASNVIAVVVGDIDFGDGLARKLALYFLNDLLGKAVRDGCSEDGNCGFVYLEKDISISCYW